MPPQAPSFSDLIDLLRDRSATRGAQGLYTFLEDGEAEESRISYAGLDLRARRIGAVLQELSATGERALLLYPPGLEYIAGFFGCLYSGLVAVPAYPPDPSRLDRTLPRLRAIIQDAQASVVLTTSFILSLSEALFEQAPDLARLRWVATDALPEGAESAWRRPDVSGETLAFLQYTSGSTGTPKGVMLGHDNLLHNLRLISHAFGIHADSVGVIWLPPYHDMGLIGGILTPLYAGIHTALLSPLDFLKRPLRWLQAVSRYRGTISGGPNFAFDLCARRITPEEREQLDLGSWELAFCGAEPIRAETLDRFVDAFGPRGFRRGSLYPCYGLAEATLIVSGGTKGVEPRLQPVDLAALGRGRAEPVEPGRPGSQVLIGCGGDLPDQEIVIAEPRTLARCDEGTVGEIWVRGPSVARGYWRNPEATAAAFDARLAGGPVPYLRTGDLGFLRGGELFVTGRSKDLIIIRGRNLYPQDLELTVERSHPALRPGGGAAFPVDVGGEERLVLVQEIDLRKAGDLRKQVDLAEAAVKAIRQAVAEEHAVTPHAVALIEAGSIPKTSSGKVQRHAARAAFLEESLRQVLVWTAEEPAPSASAPAPEAPRAPEEPADPLQGWLLAKLAARLRVRPETLDPRAPLTHQGLDSLASAELAHDIERELGVTVPLALLLEAPSVARLARELSARRAASPGEALAAPRPTSSDEPAPLSLAQQRLWFLEQLEPGSALYHIPAAIRLEGELDAQALERALQELVRRHEALRTVIDAGGAEPVQRALPFEPRPLARVDLEAEAEARREAELLRQAREEARRPFALAHSPLARFTLYRLDARTHVLLTVVHHLVADGASLGVLMRELAALYASLREGRTLALPVLPFRYADHARWQREQLGGASLESSLAWWRRRLEGAPRALSLPTTWPRPSVQDSRGATLSVRLPEELSRDLKALARREGVTPFMVLLAAFQAVLSRWAGQDDVSVGTPVAGRDRAGWQGLVGLFINTVVLRTTLSGDPDFRALLGRVRESVLGAFEHQAVPFEKLVETLRPERDLGRSPLFQVMFTLQQDALAEPRMPGLSLRTLDVDTGTAKYEMFLSLADTARGFAGTLEYSTALFDAD
ncbi:MAG TPA: condensation domain-containing protein, partial [Myxococcus sp.]|nr:condensation domain-containing protein [Myxococcus sp.]